MSIQVIGYRWFDRTYGNTYHRAKIIVNGETVHITPMAYGYGDHYVQSAQEWLATSGLLPSPMEEGEPLWRYCDRLKIQFSYSARDVKKRELTNLD